jgi:hypothetical protein
MKVGTERWWNGSDRVRSNLYYTYRGADKSLARPNSRCILTVKIFRLMLVLLYIYIYSTNIPQIIIINRIYEHQNLLSL